MKSHFAQLQGICLNEGAVSLGRLVNQTRLQSVNGIFILDRIPLFILRGDWDNGPYHS